jgi:hypothetical protein
LRIAAILGETTVTANEDGTIGVADLTEPNGLPKRWQEVAPMTFRDLNGQDTLIFKPDTNGDMQMIIAYPFMVFKRVGAFENSKLLMPVLVFSLAVMLLTLLLTPVAWLVRRHYGQKLELSATDKWLRSGIWIVFALDLIFVIGLTALVSYALTDFEILSDAGNKWFFLFQAIGVVGAIGTLIVLYHAVHAWMSKSYRIWGKLQATLLALACLGFLWFAFVGNLLVFSSSY